MRKVQVRLLKDWVNGSKNWPKGQTLTIDAKDGATLIGQDVAELVTDEESIKAGAMDAPGKKPKAFRNSGGGQALSAKAFWGVDDEDNTGTDGNGFDGFSDFLKSVTAASEGKWDSRLKDVGETVNSEGGFLVPTDFSSMIWREVYLGNPLLARAMLLPCMGSGIKVPYIKDEDRSATGFHGVGIPAAAEASTLTDISPSFGQCELTLHKIGGRARVSNEMLSDSAAAMSVLLPSVFADALSYEIEYLLLQGTGAGQPLGILNAAATIEVAAEGGQAVNSVELANLSNMWSRLSPTAQKSAIWIANQSLIPQLHSLTINVGTGGGYVFLPLGGAADTPYSTIFGRPLYFSEVLPPLGDAGDIVLFNPQAYAIAKKVGPLFRIEVSEHVRFENDQVVFRALARLDGQPLQSAPIVPRNGGDTLSNFVKLGERS